MSVAPQPDLNLLSPEVRSILAETAAIASQKGWHLYLVGGVVRDLLYFSQNLISPNLISQNLTGDTPPQSPNFTDLDLVIDSYHQTSQAGTGVEVAQALQKLHPEARLEVHGDFQTAAVIWDQDPIFGSLEIDMATARTESYAYPAANPQVETSSIYQDLYRRDFTINTLALRLTPNLFQNLSQNLSQNPSQRVIPDLPQSLSQNLTQNSFQKSPQRLPANLQSLSQNSPSSAADSPILDFFGGWQDLLNQQVRVLHANSFIDDPTRIYRAVRFAVRLGFALEPETEAQVHRSINSGIYDRILRTYPKAPALQNRLKTEIKYLLQATYSQKATKLLGNLGAWKCLHPKLELDPQLWRQVRLLDRLLKLAQQYQNNQHNPENLENLENSKNQYNLNHQSTQSIKFPKSLANLSPDWLIRLELIIAALLPSERGRVAQNLQLPQESILRLETLAQAEKGLETIEPELSTEPFLDSFPNLLPDYLSKRVLNPANLSPDVAKLAVSKVVEILRYHDTSLLLLIAGRCSSAWRWYIWQYLTVWSEVRSPLDGKALQKLGYPPGRQYKVILEALLAATLDGLVTDQPSAVAFLEAYFP